METYFAWHRPITDMTARQTATEVALVDYGLGNLRSVTRGLERAGADVTLTDDPADLGDRDPDDLRVAVTVRSCALEDGDCAREVARQQVARLRTVGSRKTRRGLSRPRGASLRRWSPGNGRCLRSGQRELASVTPRLRSLRPFR